MVIVAPSRRALLAGLGTAAVTACAGPAPESATPAPSGSSPSPASVDAAHPALARPRACAAVGFGWLPPADQVGVLRDLATAASARGVTVGLARTALGGIGIQVPDGLTVMPEFVGDVLRRDRANPDVIVIAEGGSPAEAAAGLAAVLPSGLEVRWRVAASRSALPDVGGRPMMRNAFGFAEGQSNPPPGDAASIALVSAGTVAQAGASVPAWAAGGSFLAVRVIQFAMALWDADPVERQEQIMGRRREGAWLNGAAAASPAPFANGGDASGSVTPLDAHVRRANPRTADAPEVRLLRRSWGYAAGSDDGVDDQGLLFMAYTRDLARFETVQRRLAGEALGPYTLAVGGGYFYVPRSDPSWVGELFG